jgi:hypothetical protein
MTDVALTSEDLDLSIDQQSVLRTAAGTCCRLFAGIYGPETRSRCICWGR